MRRGDVVTVVRYDERGNPRGATGRLVEGRIVKLNGTAVLVDVEGVRSWVKRHLLILAVAEAWGYHPCHLLAPSRPAGCMRAVEA